MARTPRDPNDTSESDHVRAKTVVTSISRLSEKPSGKEACLVVIYGIELGKKYNLNTASLVVGRSSKCDIQIDQESVSRNHSKIINTGKSILIRDLGSTNGTYVNDELVDEYVLRDGDLIKIGRTIFKFLTGGNIENAYHEEIYRLTTDRRPHADLQQALLHRDARARDRARAPLPAIAVAGDVRHRSLQEGQRQLRPPGRRPRAQAPGADGARARSGARTASRATAARSSRSCCPEIDGGNALPFAEKIRQIVEKAEFKFENTRIPVTISMGVASIEGNEPTESAALIKRADERLYEAKASGRNSVCA